MPDVLKFRVKAASLDGIASILVAMAGIATAWMTSTANNSKANIPKFESIAAAPTVSAKRSESCKTDTPA